MKGRFNTSYRAPEDKFGLFKRRTGKVTEYYVAEEKDAKEDSRLLARYPNLADAEAHLGFLTDPTAIPVGHPLEKRMVEAYRRAFEAVAEDLLQGKQMRRKDVWNCVYDHLYAYSTDRLALELLDLILIEIRDVKFEKRLMVQVFPTQWVY